MSVAMPDRPGVDQASKDPEAAEQRSRNARRAGLANVARHGPAKVSEKAREAFVQRFYDETDPALPDDERQAAADAALRIHMMKLAEKSAAARRRR